MLLKHLSVLPRDTAERRKASMFAVLMQSPLLVLPRGGRELNKLQSRAKRNHRNNNATRTVVGLKGPGDWLGTPQAMPWPHQHLPCKMPEPELRDGHLQPRGCALETGSAGL